MRIKHWGVCVAIIVSMLPGLSAFGHDPLRDDHDRYHSVHHERHQHNLPDPIDLSDVRALVVSFRETGNDQYLEDAWTLLGPALAEESPEPETLIAASFVAQSRHEFEYAVNLLTRALAIKENNDEGWLLLASIKLVLGEAKAARMACRQLRDVAPVILVTCNARVALATGDHEMAFERLQRILNVTHAQRLPSDVLAWSYSVAGDLAVAAGKPDEAMRLYRYSLTLADRTQVRAALVDVLLSREEFDAAWEILENGSPALPLLVRRLIVAKHLGRSRELQPELSKVQREFAVWIANEDWLHAREMARFFIDVLDQPELARRLAVINIGLQKEPEDQRLLIRTRPVASRTGKAVSSSVRSFRKRLDRVDLAPSTFECF